MEGNLTGQRLRELLAETADDLGRRGVDNLFSHGRVNATNAVQMEFEMWQEIHH